MNNFTQDDLVRYLYKETSELKTAAIKAALLTDFNLKESYEKLVNAQQGLQDINFSPRQQSIDKILEYAAKKQGQLSSI
ncbi:MAG: hypothetical protein ABIP35_11380 [Ginsengibacter sp.]